MRKFAKLIPFILVGIFLALWLVAGARGATPAIPSTCGKYKATLTRVVSNRLGPAAPISMYAAQMMQESACNSEAKSGAGALGLTQFMPATADWIPQLDASLAPANPMNPTWAINAQVAYMSWLAKRNPGKIECDTSAFALVSYNGGEGWLRRDQASAAAAGADPKVWFGSVEAWPDRRRSAAAIAENRGYPQRILLHIQPAFIDAGWGRGVTCTLNEGQSDGNVNGLREGQSFSWTSNSLAVVAWLQRRLSLSVGSESSRFAYRQ